MVVQIYFFDHISITQDASIILGQIKSSILEKIGIWLELESSKIKAKGDRKSRNQKMKKLVILHNIMMIHIEW